MEQLLSLKSIQRQGVVLIDQAIVFFTPFRVNPVAGQLDNAFSEQELPGIIIVQSVNTVFS